MHRGAQGRQTALPLSDLAQQEAPDREGEEKEIQPVPPPSHAAPRNQVSLCLARPISTRTRRSAPTSRGFTAPSQRSTSPLTPSISSTQICSSRDRKSTRLN